MLEYRPSTMQAQRFSAVALAMFCLFYDLPFQKVDTFYFAGLCGVSGGQ
jgi:hypothetical protein